MIANKMTALELADWLYDYANWDKADEAAAMLRKQHEAIRQLREALYRLCPVPYENYYDEAYEALAATEGFGDDQNRLAATLIAGRQ